MIYSQIQQLAHFCPEVGLSQFPPPRILDIETGIIQLANCTLQSNLRGVLFGRLHFLRPSTVVTNAVIDRKLLVAVRVDTPTHQRCPTLAKSGSRGGDPAALNTNVFARRWHMELVIEYDNRKQ